jgi:hypothetical protein
MAKGSWRYPKLFIWIGGTAFWILTGCKGKLKDKFSEEHHFAAAMSGRMIFFIAYCILLQQLYRLFRQTELYSTLFN